MTSFALLPPQQKLAILSPKSMGTGADDTTTSTADSSSIIPRVASLFTTLRTSTDAPYWLALALPAVAVRVSQWPLTVYATRASATLAHAQALALARVKAQAKRAAAATGTASASADVKAVPSGGDIRQAALDLVRADATKADSLPKHLRDAAAYLKHVREHKETLRVAPWVVASRTAHPLWMIAAPVVALPSFIGMAFAARHVCSLPSEREALQRGGLPFKPLQDLTRAPFEWNKETKTGTLSHGGVGMLVPFAVYASNYWQVRLVGDTVSKSASLLMQRVYLAIEWATLGVLVTASFQPYGVLCYWGTASAMGFLQVFAFNGPRGGLLRERLCRTLPSASLKKVSEEMARAPTASQARANASAELRRRKATSSSSSSSSSSTTAPSIVPAAATTIKRKGKGSKPATKRRFSTSASPPPPPPPPSPAHPPIDATLEHKFLMNSFRLFFTIALAGGVATLAPSALTGWALYGHAVAMIERCPTEPFAVSTALSRISLAADWNAKGISDAVVVNALLTLKDDTRVRTDLREQASALADRLVTMRESA